MKAADERRLIGLAIVAWEDGLETGKSGMPQNNNPYQHHQDPKLKQRWLDGWRTGHRMAEANRQVLIAKSRLERNALPADMVDVAAYVAARPKQFSITAADVALLWPNIINAQMTRHAGGLADNEEEER